MKKILITLFSAVTICLSQVYGQIPVYPVIIDDNLPAEVISNLEKKVDNLLSSYGYGVMSTPERIVMSVSLNLIENNVTSTNPPRVAKKIEALFKMGDVIDNCVFGFACVSISGIGTNDTKAYISAISNLKADNKAIKKMFADVDSSLEEYYTNNLNVILDKARAIAQGGDFDGAITYLVSIPPVNPDCYNACQDMAISLYAEKVNQSSQKAYSNALAAWTANKTRAGAKEALKELKLVDPASESYPDALKLWDAISSKLDQDEIAEREHAQQVYDDKVQLRNNIVDAIKAIGVAFGQGQPQSVTKIVRHW